MDSIIGNFEGKDKLRRHLIAGSLARRRQLLSQSAGILSFSSRMPGSRRACPWDGRGEPALLYRSVPFLNQIKIRTALKKRNTRLASRETTGEVSIYSGACLSHAFAGRNPTRDADAIFEPAAIVRKAAFEVALEMGWSWNWPTFQTNSGNTLMRMLFSKNRPEWLRICRFERSGVDSDDSRRQSS